MKHFNRAMLTLAFALLALTSIGIPVSATEIPRMISYQGMITDSEGDPVTQPGLSFRFLIFDDPIAGDPGSALWIEVTEKDVVDGLVTHNMGSLIPMPDNLFTEFDELWLEVWVDGEAIEPRTRIVSSAYAFRVSTIDSATGGAITGDVSIDGRLNVEQSGTGGDAGYFWISDAGNNSNAVTGFTMGTGAGGYFANNLGGTGLIAYGDAQAIQCLSILGTGVYAVSASLADLAKAVHGEISNSNPGAYSAAVRGENKGTGGLGIGVWGSHDGSGYGVYGTATTGVAGYFVTSGGGAPSLYARTEGTGDAGQFQGGDISVKDATGAETVEIAPSEGSTGAQIVLREADGTTNGIVMDAEWVDGPDRYGRIDLYQAGNNTVVIRAGESPFTGGEIRLREADGTTNGVIIDGEKVDDVNHGQIDLYMGGTRTISIEGGEESTGGQIRLRKADGTPTITLDAELGLGGDGRITTDELQITGGSDLSEQFDIHSLVGNEPPSAGMVVCIDPQKTGELVVSSRAYDPTVAGIISGAGGIKPGMLMGQRGTAGDGQFAVALTGRVYCRADASHGTIKPGDLLTTSYTPGHAMKVTDFSSSQGAIIGKAMSSLQEGKGLVLVLVSLQ